MIGQLVPLPRQPNGVPWPAAEWPAGHVPTSIGARLDALLSPAFAEPQPETIVQTNAMVTVHRGFLVDERYAEGVVPEDLQPSWSMAKSMLHAAVGILVRDARLDISQRAAVPEWQTSGDERAKITLDQLLRMASGLRFNEDYVDAGVSDVFKMLFQPGADDTGAFAAEYPLDHAPDVVHNYSSGTSNIISRIVRDVVGSNEAYQSFLRTGLFHRIGMTSATPRFDKAGTWIASSYCFATPRDFARFGLLYMRDGVWEGERILPEGWVDYARAPAPPQPIDPDGRRYGAHWWLLNDNYGTFYASGYLGQYIFIVPALDLIMVRSGSTPAERRPHVMDLLKQIIGLFAEA